MAKNLKQIREAAPGYSTSGTLGGQALQARSYQQKAKNPQGLQKTGPKNVYEAAVSKVKDKMMKNKPGKTDTGQKANIINTEPEHKMMTGYH